MSRVRSNFITNRLADGAPTASLGLIISGVTTSTTLNVDDKIVHTGDTNTAIRFPAADTISFETGGSRRLQISNDGIIVDGTQSGNNSAILYNGTGFLGFYASTNSGVNRDFRFFSSNSNSNESLRIDSTGMVSFYGTNEQDIIHITTGNTAGNTFANIRGDNEAGIRIRGGGSYDGGTIELAGGLRNTDPGIIKFSTGTGSSVTERLRITSAGHLKQTNSSGSTIYTLKRSNANTTGAFGTLNFAASDDHSVANIYAVGDGDNEGANLIFKTTTAAASEDPYDASLVERLRIGSTGYVSGNVNVPAWFGKQDTAHDVTNGAWTAIFNLGNDVVNPSMNNGGWDESTGTFTVQAGQAGTYYVFGQVGIDDIQSDDIVRTGISKNDGTPSYFGEQRAHSGEVNQIYQAYVAMLLNLNVGDTVKLKVYHNEGTTELTEPNRCYFGGYRIAV